MCPVFFELPEVAYTFKVFSRLSSANLWTAATKVRYWIIVIRNQKIVWKHRPYCWYFCLNLKYLGCPCREYTKTSKNGGFFEELLSENDFQAVLATFCCHDYGTNTSEAVQKIDTDQILSQMLFVCYSTLNSQNISINNSEKRLVTYLLE